jgi:beta-xylosidase
MKPFFPASRLFFPALGAALALTLAARGAAAEAAPWQPDLGDGRYRNPVLYADYSDPDVVRVGEDYWLVSSSFSHVPGLPLLHSRDLVNWTLAGHALPRLVPEAAFAAPQHGKGVWAPSIRHHAGRYRIYYPDPDSGIYLVTAEDPRGPWTAPVLVQGGKGLIDPCPLWDDDGRVYLIHAWARSRAGFNNVLTLLRLDATGERVEQDLGVIIDGGRVPVPGFHTLEGPKLYRRNGWYYVFAPAGGVAEGWQSVFRSRRITGPYEHRIVLAQGGSPVNGPHQGALVDTPAGEGWFLHFQDQGPYGRVVHLEPVKWRDDWPLLGTAAEGGAEPGEPVAVHAKPGPGPRAAPATGDEFAGAALAPQWQWQANPAPDWASLSARPGWLRLAARPEPRPGNLYDDPALLLQKFPAPAFTVTAKVELAAAADGDAAGLIVFGSDYAWIGVKRVGGAPALVRAVRTEAAKGEPQVESVLAACADGPVFLRVQVSAGGKCRFAWSLDGRRFTPAGGVFPATAGRWVGAKVGLFAAGSAGAHADCDFFRVEGAAE